MISMDDTWLKDNGVAISTLVPEDRDLLVDKAYGELERRVGEQLASKMSTKEIDEFDLLSGDEDAAINWLEKHYPQYESVVQDELKKLEASIQAADDKTALILSWGNDPHKLAIDNTWLRKAGAIDAETPPEDVQTLAVKVYEELELRVGKRLAAKLSDEQLVEFDKVLGSGDEDKPVAWLKKTIPGYAGIVHQEEKKLRKEIKAADDKKGLITGW